MNRQKLGSRARRGPAEPPSSSNWRQLLIPVLVGLVLVAFGLRVGQVWATNEAGRASYQAGESVNAVDAFTANQAVNLLQPWVAEFNLGTARHQQGDWIKAEAQFRTALALAPRTQVCMISLNLAWTLEARGDEAAASGNPAGAVSAWQAAQQALDAAGCESGSTEQATAASDTGDRLAEKLDPAQSTPSSPPSSPASPSPTPSSSATPSTSPSPSNSDRPASAKASELEDRNRSAKAQNQQANEGGAAPSYADTPW